MKFEWMFYGGALGSDDFVGVYRGHVGDDVLCILDGICKKTKNWMKNLQMKNYAGFY